MRLKMGPNPTTEALSLTLVIPPAHSCLPAGDDLNVAPSGGQPQFAQVSLEDSVHVCGVQHFSLALFNKQLGLLGHLQRYVLLGRGPADGVPLLQICMPTHHFERQAPAPSDERAAVLLPPELSPPHCHHNVIHLKTMYHVLPIVEPDLPVAEADDKCLEGSAPANLGHPEASRWCRQGQAEDFSSLYVVAAQ